MDDMFWNDDTPPVRWYEDPLPWVLLLLLLLTFELRVLLVGIWLLEEEEEEEEETGSSDSDSEDFGVCPRCEELEVSFVEALFVALFNVEVLFDTLGWKLGTRLTVDEFALLFDRLVLFSLKCDEERSEEFSPNTSPSLKSSNEDPWSGPKYFSRALRYFCSLTLMSSRAGGAPIGVDDPDAEAGDFVESEPVPNLLDDIEDGDAVLLTGVLDPVEFGFLFNSLTCDGLYAYCLIVVSWISNWLDELNKWRN